MHYSNKALYLYDAGARYIMSRTVEGGREVSMANIMSALKSEISRLARKEAKQVFAPVQRASANCRGLIAGLRKQLDALQGEVAALRRAAPKAEKALAAAQEPQGRFWITGHGIKALRKRLGLTQGLFGKLAGVSVPTVIKWEGAKGKAPIRLRAAIARLQAIRKMGKKQAAQVLGTGKAKAVGGGKAKPKARRRAKKV